MHLFNTLILCHIALNKSGHKRAKSNFIKFDVWYTIDSIVGNKEYLK